MDYTNDPSTNQHPNQHDYDQLETIYGHFDSITTLSRSLLGAGQRKDQGDFENSAEWGRGLRKDGHGRTSLYERNLGNGEKIFTFVIWAD